MGKDNDYVSIYVKSVPIKLGQFLKLANLVQDGFEAKAHILEEQVLVNGEIETRRGRQLVPGDIISFDNNNYQVTKQEIQSLRE